MLLNIKVINNLKLRRIVEVRNDLRPFSKQSAHLLSFMFFLFVLNYAFVTENFKVGDSEQAKQKSKDSMAKGKLKFQDQYSPRKLGNWEYPKWYPERPRQRFKSTKIIADDCGRILEGYKKENPWGNYVGTWDLPKRITREYVNKLVAPPERLIKLWGKKKKETEQKPEEQPQEPEAEKEKAGSLPTIDQNKNSAAQRSFQKRNKSSSALDLRPRYTKLEPIRSLQKKNKEICDIKPGTLDDKIKNILDSVEQKQEKEVEHPELVCKEIKALPKRSEKTEDIFQTNEKFNVGEKGSHEFLNCSFEHLNKLEALGGTDGKQLETEFTTLNKPEEEKSMKTPESKTVQPVKNGSSGFQIAKRYHDENLSHKPLPDVIDDPVFKALNSGRKINPGAALNVSPLPSAIGWKPYSAPRPTECSKLKVFRPKTGAEKQKVQKDFRPKTGDPTYKKRFLPIDLAICWDLKPDDPSDEPKRSPHIDGSNGSVAPAVFTMIRPTEPEEADQNISSSPQALAERITKGIDDYNVATVPSQVNGKARSPMSITSNKEAVLSCIKSSKDESQKPSGGTPESLNSISPQAAEYARTHPKTAWTKEDTSKALSHKLQDLQKQHEKTGVKKSSLSRSPSESSQITKKKHHQSTPNLTTDCDGSHCGTEKSSPDSVKTSDRLKNHHWGNENVITDESKYGEMAGQKKTKNGQKKRHCSACKKSTTDCTENREKTEFKTAFKAGVFRSESTNSGSSSAAKSYKVPKMRLPYAKRSYSIGTLVPPFSVWRESNGQEYPEHWRLASVYQHSYKPINFRKRPLLASVYQ